MKCQISEIYNKGTGFKAVFRLLSISLLLSVSFAANSAVFDIKMISSGLFAPDIAALKQGALTARVNGAPLKIESYITGKSADDIMRYYADNAEKKNYELINGKEISRLAAYLINMGRPESPDLWYYLFYRQANGDMTMITAGEFGGQTRLVTARIYKSNTGTKGFDDGLRHYPGLEKVLSIELLSGQKVINFANFYRTQGANRHEVAAYYEAYLQKRKWIIQKRYSNAGTDMFLLEKNGSGRMLNIFSSSDNEKWVMVTG